MAYVKIKGGCIFAYCGREKDKMGEFRNKKQTPINERKITKKRIIKIGMKCQGRQRKHLVQNHSSLFIVVNKNNNEKN